MKKTYVTPEASSIELESEEILSISYTGSGALLDDRKPADPAKDFGDVDLF